MSEAQKEWEWEQLIYLSLYRIKVDGGHIYCNRDNNEKESICFVPEIDLTRYQAHLRDAYNKGFADGLQEGKIHKEMMNPENPASV